MEYSGVPTNVRIESPDEEPIRKRHEKTPKKCQSFTTKNKFVLIGRFKSIIMTSTPPESEKRRFGFPQGFHRNCIPSNAESKIKFIITSWGHKELTLVGGFNPFEKY